MRRGCRNGYKVFDFGGAGSPDREDGAGRFEKQFGGEQINYGRLIKVYRPLTLKLVEFGMKLRNRI